MGTVVLLGFGVHHIADPWNDTVLLVLVGCGGFHRESIFCSFAAGLVASFSIHSCDTRTTTRGLSSHFTCTITHNNIPQPLSNARQVTMYHSCHKGYAFNSDIRSVFAKTKHLQESGSVPIPKKR